MGAFTDFVVTITKTFSEQENNTLPQGGHLMGKRSKGTYCCRSDHSLLEINSIIDEANVA